MFRQTLAHWYDSEKPNTNHGRILRLESDNNITNDEIQEDMPPELPKGVLAPEEDKPQYDVTGFTHPNKSMVDLIHEYKDRFQGCVYNQNLKRFNTNNTPHHDIELLPDVKPYRSRPFRLSPQQKLGLQKILDQYLSRNFIRPSTSDWAAATFLVPKKTYDKDGNQEWRMVVDYRELNKRSKRQAYPLPKIDELMGNFLNKQWFTAIDFESGYHQVPLKEESKPLAAFASGIGLYEFNVLPFGTHSAPPTFQHLMDHVLAEPI